MKKRKTIALPTQQQIDELVKRGDIEQLKAINERLAKTANQRMAQLYKSGVKHSSALERAKYYTEQVSEVQTGGVFSRSKKLSLDTLILYLKLASFKWNMYSSERRFIFWLKNTIYLYIQGLGKKTKTL